METSKGTMTNATGLESRDGVPGFCTWMVSAPADCASEGFRAVAQTDALEHVVPRETPFRRIVEAELPLPATKFKPCTTSGMLSNAPAMALEGSIVSIVGPLVSAIVADADFVRSAWLVAVTKIAFGDGAMVGAEKRPPAFTEPQAAPPHPWPATALSTVQVTLVLAEPVTLAENCCVLSTPVEGGTNAYAGETTTATGPEGPAMRTLAVPLRDGSARLVAVRITGFVAGVDVGAK